MATNTIVLPVAAPEPGFTCDIEGGTQAKLLFDAGANEQAVWSFPMPEDYGSALALTLKHSNESNQSGANNIMWKASLMAVTPDNDEDPEADNFDTSNDATVTLDDNELDDKLRDTDITMTHDASVAAKDLCRLKVVREAATDTAGGDVALRAILFEYTTL